MKYLCLLLFFISGCVKTSCDPCCETCLNNLCKCNFIKENCICETGSCNCRFYIDNKDNKKIDYLRKYLPKVVVAHDPHPRTD